MSRSSGLYKSILGGVVNLDGLPYALEKMMERPGDNKFRRIHLPHKVTIEDIKNMYKGEVNLDEQMMLFLKAHNDLLDNVLVTNGYELDTWGFVEPPLSRLLSEPGFTYQKAMLKHPLVKAQMAACLWGEGSCKK